MVSGTRQMYKSGTVLLSCPPISISTNDLFLDLVLSSIPSEDDEAIHVECTARKTSLLFAEETLPKSIVKEQK